MRPALSSGGREFSPSGNALGAPCSVSRALAILAGRSIVHDALERQHRRGRTEAQRRRLNKSPRAVWVIDLRTLGLLHETLESKSLISLQRVSIITDMVVLVGVIQHPQ